jgi:pSer/pThr/pTyr-binding forkhead associated (FHA) protein
VRRGGEAVLEDHSTYGTFVNGERVQRRAQLAAGDRVRVGTPGVEFELVRIADAEPERGTATGGRARGG